MHLDHIIICCRIFQLLFPLSFPPSFLPFLSFREWKKRRAQKPCSTERGVIHHTGGGKNDYWTSLLATGDKTCTIVNSIIQICWDQEYSREYFKKKLPNLSSELCGQIHHVYYMQIHTVDWQHGQMKLCSLY